MVSDSAFDRIKRALDAFVGMIIRSDSTFHWYGWHQTSKKGNVGKEHSFIIFLKGRQKNDREMIGVDLNLS